MWAIVVVIMMMVVVLIDVIADPPHSTIAIADSIMIAAPGLRIVESTMAMALFFLEGGQCIPK